MKVKFFSGIAAGLLLAGAISSAGATTLTSTISMDNGYAAYLSTSDAVQGIQFGAANNWGVSYTDTMTLAAGTDYFLHIYGYDQGWIAGFLGQFSLSGSDHVFANSTTSLLSGTANWHGNNTGWGAPDGALVDLGANGVWPWGARPGISGSARWIWSGNAETNDSAYFSTKIAAVSAPVPEPETYAMLLVGLAMMGFTARRKNNLGA